jgi:hypothetical protein
MSMSFANVAETVRPKHPADRRQARGGDVPATVPVPDDALPADPHHDPCAVWIGVVLVALRDATAPDGRLRGQGSAADRPTPLERDQARTWWTCAASRADRAMVELLAGLVPGALDRLGEALVAAGWEPPAPLLVAPVGWQRERASA